MRRDQARLSLRLGLTLLVSLWGAAQHAAAAPPKWKFLFPSGAQVGTTIDVEAHGSFDHWPVSVWVDRPGVSLVAKEKKGELTLTVSPAALPGLYAVRFYDVEGATPLVPLIVGTLPEVREQEPNDTPSKPHELSAARATISGRLERKGDVDTFAVRLDKGQTLVAEIDSHRTLASPLDAVLEVLSPAGFVLAHNDDDQEIDPRIAFVAPQAGTYLVRVFGFPAAPDSSIALAGGDTYIYRLTLATDGFIDYTLPLAVSTPSAPVELFGWNLPDDARHLLPAAMPGERVALLHPRVGNLLTLPVVNHPSILAVEPSVAEQPQRIDVPVTISGRIESPRDKDTFRTALHKGDTLLARVESRALGYALDPVLELRDAQAKSPIRVDDTGAGRDAELTFAVPADGDYDLSVHDLHGQGGARFVYRLTATIAKPDYALSLASDSFTVAAGQKLELPVSVERLHGFAEPINLHVTGLPEGTTVEAATSAGEGDTAKSVKLSITAGATPFSGPIRVTGESAGATPIARTAQFAVGANTHKISDGWLTIKATENK